MCMWWTEGSTQTLCTFLRICALSIDGMPNCQKAKTAPKGYFGYINQLLKLCSFNLHKW